MSIDTATGKEAPAEISSERVKDIFSSIAKKYERFNAVSSFGAYKSWLAGMMRQAPIEPTDDVLDIAGGTGDVTFTVARAKHPRHIQCTDLVNEMLDVARSALRRRGRMRRARRFRGGRRAEHPLRGRELRRPHHGIRHPQHARPPARALRDVPRAEAGRASGVPGVLHAAERGVARAVQLLPEAPYPLLGRSYHRGQGGALCTCRSPSRRSRTKRASRR